MIDNSYGRRSTAKMIPPPGQKTSSAPKTRKTSSGPFGPAVGAVKGAAGKLAEMMATKKKNPSQR